MQNEMYHVFSAYYAPYLTVYSENVAFVYDVNSAEWLQTMSLKQVT